MKRNWLRAAALAAIAGPAAAAPSVALDYDDTIPVCRASTGMIVDGASDEEEMAYLERQAAARGWSDSATFNQLLAHCVIYKSGYIDGRTYNGN